MAAANPQHRRRVAKYRGHSLIEVVAVVTLVALMTAVVGGAARPAYQRAVHRHWVKRIERFECSARRLARRHGRPMMIEFNSRRLTLQPSGRQLDLPAASGLERFPPRMTIDSLGRSSDYSVTIVHGTRTTQMRVLGQTGQCIWEDSPHLDRSEHFLPAVKAGESTSISRQWLP